MLTAAVVPASAQQPADPLRSQIMTFEDALRRGIEVAGETLSRQVKEQLQIPVFRFGFDPTGPVVRGWPIDGFGFHFDVQVPDVAETGMLVLQMWTVPRGSVPAPRPEGPAQPVASGGGVVKDDSMSGRRAPPASGLGAVLDVEAVNRMYRENVRAALVDAILNNPGVLNMRPAEMLAVSAAGVGQSTLYRLSPSSARMTLYISGADLAALREGRLIRDEARKRIREQTF
jgi:hypothetical protein